MRETVAIGLTFILGSIPFGVLLTRWRSGIDLRAVGSGNIGATNAIRASGLVVGVATLLLDALKGAAGLSLASWILNGWPHGWVEAVLLLAPVLGHCCTPWLGFRGGKGVATAAGVLAWADWRLLLAGLLAFVAMAVPTRYVSLGSVGSAAVVGIAAPLVYGWSGFSYGVLAIATLVVWRHRGNLKRLWQGTESRFGGTRRTAATGSG